MCPPPPPLFLAFIMLFSSNVSMFLLYFRCNREKTFRSMMFHLLTGPCQKLASSRVTAIKEGRSVSAYFESLAGGLEDKESVKEKIDLEIKSALDAGMNFNVSYCLLSGYSQ